MRLVDRLINADPQERMKIYAGLEPDERMALANLLDAEIDNPWAKWEKDPVGFIQDGLGEVMWSKQREIANALINNQRVAVPACHGPGKSHLSARLAAWWVSAHPQGTTLCVTIAPTHRQVRNIIWPHIRKTATKAKLKGEVLTQTWKMNGDIVAYGFSPNPYDESAAQGIHMPNLLIIVDEAGGIGEVVGRSLEALMTGGNTRLLLLGNPPTDQEDSWFERACNSDLYTTIPIGAYDTPNFTGEETGMCQSCPVHIAPHPVATHLVDQRWVDDVVGEFGDDSPFVEARVHARFPKAVANKVIPFMWADLASQNEKPLESPRIRLGVDVASDGGDEFVIARMDGYRIKITHKSSGIQNHNAVDVAGVVAREIEECIAIHEERGVQDKLHVKIDTIGVGWGVVSLLKKWCDERQWNANIIGVNVSERANDPDKFRNQRAEMWWNGRLLLQPNDAKEQDVTLDTDRATLAQLSTPTFKSDSAGRIQIESKVEMKRRGMTSPDRGEAILLAMYEPAKGRAIIPAIPVSLGQANGWRVA